MLSKVSADEACIMPGFQHYVSGVPEPFEPLPFCRCRSAVAGVPFPLPFRAEATELDGNHFPLTMNVKQRVLLFLLLRRRRK